MIDHDCGIPFSRITSWLDDELCLPRISDNEWSYNDNGSACSVTAEPLEERKLGVLALERTHLLVDGDEAASESFEKLFTLRFISAGG